MSVVVVLEEDSLSAFPADGCKRTSEGYGCRCVCTQAWSSAGLEFCMIVQSCCEQLFGLAPHHAGRLQIAATVCHTARDCCMVCDFYIYIL